MAKRTIQEIRRKAEILKNRLKREEPHENFGDKEARILEEFIGDIYEYDYFDRQEIWNILDNFRNWCANYSWGNYKKSNKKIARILKKVLSNHRRVVF